MKTYLRVLENMNAWRSQPDVDLVILLVMHLTIYCVCYSVTQIRAPRIFQGMFVRRSRCLILCLHNHLRTPRCTLVKAFHEVGFANYEC